MGREQPVTKNSWIDFFQGHLVCWSNTTPTTGQVKCKWLLTSMQLRIEAKTTSAPSS
jgi:hypothetical protein